MLVFLKIIYVLFLFQGDVIVCSVGQDLDLNKEQSNRSLLDAGGRRLVDEIETKYRNGVKHGEVATISGGNLQCQELYLGYLPCWKDGNGKVCNSRNLEKVALEMFLFLTFWLLSSAMSLQIREGLNCMTKKNYNVVVFLIRLCFHTNARKCVF